MTQQQIDLWIEGFIQRADNCFSREEAIECRKELYSFCKKHGIENSQLRLLDESGVCEMLSMMIS